MLTQVVERLPLLRPSSLQRLFFSTSNRPKVLSLTTIPFLQVKNGSGAPFDTQQIPFYEPLDINKEPFLVPGPCKRTRRALSDQTVSLYNEHRRTGGHFSLLSNYSVVTDLSNRKVAERFQRSGETIQVSR
jgi:hypothetical protein